MTGLEPATSGVTGRCSNQLSYIPNRVRLSNLFIAAEGGPVKHSGVAGPGGGSVGCYLLRRAEGEGFGSGGPGARHRAPPGMPAGLASRRDETRKGRGGV